MKISNLIDLNMRLSKTVKEGNLARYYATLDDDTIKVLGYGNNAGLKKGNYVQGHDIAAVVFNTDLNDTNTISVVVAGKPAHKGVMMLKIGGIPFYSTPVVSYFEPNHPVLKNTVGVTVFSLFAEQFITLKEGEVSLELYYEPTKPVVYFEPKNQPDQKG